MLSTPLIHPPKKSPIKFIRNVAAPKQYPSHKPHSTGTITLLNHQPHLKSSTSTSPTTTITIILTLPDSSTMTLLFPYDAQTRIQELLGFMRGKVGLENGLCYFQTGNNIITDYFITLKNRYVREINCAKLYLNVCKVEVSSKITFKSIQILKCVGSGGFSKVFLARVYGILTAIKLIDKQFVSKTAKQSIIQNERTILQLCSGHPFITKLHFSFQSNKYVALGMQFCNGGELFNLLRRVKKMKEGDAKFYFIETLMAIQHLHAKGVLYRDLKPENVIIDEDGHIRLADFGLSKVIGRGVTYSFCGSAEYMSPQMLLKKGHSYQIDYYCLGALLYELVTGLPPFYSQNQSQLFNGILHNQLTFPSHATISDELKFFLYKILQKEPEKRFKSIDQILSDPWVAVDFNRAEVMGKGLVPPFATANFCYNFDDGEFLGQEAGILKAIKVESQAVEDPKLRNFEDFYYQSEQIIKIRNQVEQSSIIKRNFFKNKSKQRQPQFYISSRHSSVHSQKHLLLQTSKHSDSKQFTKYQDFTPTSSSILTQKNSINHIKSAQTLKKYPNMYHPPHPKPKPYNIYTTNPKFPASPTHKSPSPFPRRSSQKPTLNTSLSREHASLDWSSSKQKSNSLDKGYNAYRRMQLGSLYGRNYLAEYRERYGGRGVRKMGRGGERVGFGYNR